MERKPIGVKSTNLSLKLYELPKVRVFRSIIIKITLHKYDIHLLSTAMQKHLKAGGKVSDLPPPPPSDTSKTFE
jgi:hypothetical protein